MFFLYFVTFPSHKRQTQNSNMKQLLFMLLSILTTTIACSQEGDTKVFNDPNAESRNVTGYKGVKVSHGISLIIKQGNEEGVAVSASEKRFRDNIRTVVENGVLNIYYDTENFWKNEKKNKNLKAYVSVKTLEKLTGSSGSTIVVDGSLKTTKLMIGLSSGSSLKGEVQATELDIDQNSGATSRLNGKAESVTVETSSGSGFYGYNLVTDVCHARASSGAHIEITVNREMDVKASSGGGIRYKGNGVIKSVSTSSGGSVSKNG